LLKKGNGFEPVPIGPDGSFSAPIKKETPALGELVAYDAAGRRAEVGHPSQVTGAPSAVKLGGAPQKADKVEDASKAKRAEKPPEPPKPVRAEKAEAPKPQDKHHAALKAATPEPKKQQPKGETAFEVPVQGTDGVGAAPAAEPAEDAKKADDSAKKDDAKKKKDKKDKANEDEIELNWDE
jgi:hypothetical protein